MSRYKSGQRVILDKGEIVKLLYTAPDDCLDDGDEYDFIAEDLLSGDMYAITTDVIAGRMQ